MIRLLLCVVLLANYSCNKQKTSSEVQPVGTPPPVTQDQGATKSMGVLYSIVWNTDWNLNGCKDEVLVLQVDAQGRMSLFTPPDISSSLNLLVLPITATATTCIIGNNKFIYLQSAYRDVLATTDLGCTTGDCWQHESSSLTAYASGSNEPAASESWIKRSGNTYIYFKIASAIPPVRIPVPGAPVPVPVPGMPVPVPVPVPVPAPLQPMPIFFKTGSARIEYIHSSLAIAVQATVYQGSRPKAGASIAYTVTCPGQDPVALTAVTSNAAGLAKTTKVMSTNSNKNVSIDSINLPTCRVSAAINGGTAVDIIAGQPQPNQSGIALKVNWGLDATRDICNIKDTKTTIIGVNGDGSLRRVYSSGQPNVGAVNLLFLPVASSGASCTVESIAYTIDSTTFDSTTTAANLGCNADNCWQYLDDYITHKVIAFDGDSYTPDSGEKWIKKTGNKYVLHVLQ